MEISRDNQKALVGVMLRVLSRGLCAVSMFDKRVASEIELLGEDFSFSLCAGMPDSSACIALKTENGRLVRVAADNCVSDVSMRFKDLSGVAAILSGRTGAASAFVQHRMLVWGDSSRAVTLIRIIDITLSYLILKPATKGSTRSAPKVQSPRLLVYFMLPFAPFRGGNQALNTLEYKELPDADRDPDETSADEHVQQGLGAAK